MNWEMNSTGCAVIVLMQNIEFTNQSRSGFVRTTRISRNELREFALRGNLFAIIDACNAPVVPTKMQELGKNQAISLFEATPQEDYWAVAPYLSCVDDTLLRWLQEYPWKQPWGIFVLSKMTLRDLYDHFRQLLFAQLPDGMTWLFRYYDPVILNAFLQISSIDDLKIVFGPVRAYCFCSYKTLPDYELIMMAGEI